MSSFQKIKSLLENKETKVGNLSDSSINMYLRNLKKLNDGDEWNNLNFLKDTNGIIDKINKFKESTQRNYYASIVSILKLVKGFKKYEQIYSDKMMNLKNKIQESLDNNEPNEKQNKKWGDITWTDIIAKYNQLTESIESIKKADMKKENKYNKLLNWVVASFYVLISPRRNQDIQYLNLTDPDKNYVDLKNKTIQFNIFKTSKTTDNKDRIITIPDDLLNVIKHWMKLTSINKDYLLRNFNGEHLKQVNSINRILNKVFNLGSSDLRHIYLTSKYADILESMKTDAKNMAHDLNTQKEYIKIK